MSNTIKSPRTAYLILAAGVVLGGISTASILGGYAVGKAHAQKVPARLAGTIAGENLEALRGLDASFASLVEYVSPAVVNIRSEAKGRSDVFGNRMGSVGGEGSGVIIRPDGWVLTNDHVVGGYDKVTVLLNDGREFPGTVRRSDYSDLAVVKIEAKDLPTVQFADSNKVRPGQFAIAVGSPFGFENSVTIGHVSALSRQTTIGDQVSGSVRTYPDLIQTDAAINMGNSGGPLLDVEGRVIGINTAIYSGTGGSVGIGFAIPANQARLTAESLIEKGKIVRGYMGLQPENLREYQKKELGVNEGAYIATFGRSDEASPARSAGLKEGDVVTKIGGLAITNQSDLRNAMLRYGPGETVTVEYWRNKQRHTASVKLTTPPAPPATAPRRSGRNAPPPGVPDLQIPDFGDLFPRTERDGESTVPPVREGKARLGIQIEAVNATLRQQFSIPESVKGVVVMAVEPGSVAEKHGMKLGDVILKIGDVEIEDAEDVSRAMTGVKWGETLPVKFGRYGKGVTAISELPFLFR